MAGVAKPARTVSTKELNTKGRRLGGPLQVVQSRLELFEEVAGRAGDVHSAGNAALAILDALDDAGGLGALGAVGALLGIHDLLAVTGFGDLCHCSVLPETKVWLAWFAGKRKGIVRRPTLRFCICGLLMGWAEQESARAKTEESSRLILTCELTAHGKGF
jgi:hypothetical protein